MPEQYLTYFYFRILFLCFYFGFLQKEVFFHVKGAHSASLPAQPGSFKALFFERIDIL
jgi:hypothetical protein